MSDNYIPWWVPGDHPSRGGTTAVSVEAVEAGPAPPPQPPSELSDAAQVTLIRLARGTPAGTFVEVGVYRGGSAWHLARIAEERGDVLHLFDTFTGIPEAGPQDTTFPVGAFGNTSEETVRAAIPSAVFHVGRFPDTMPADLGGLAFVHCDCDQYWTTGEVIKRLFPLLVAGGVMLFDDYDGVPGARQAVDEAFPAGVDLTPEGKAFVRKGQESGTSTASGTNETSGEGEGAIPLSTGSTSRELPDEHAGASSSGEGVRDQSG